MLNTLFTLQDLCHLWIKKMVCFLCSPPSKRNPCGVDRFCFVCFSCWLRWLNLEICHCFCTDESWPTVTATLASEGSVGAVLLNSTSLIIDMLSCWFCFNYRIILMAGFVASSFFFFSPPSVRSNIWSTEKDSDLFSSLISTVIS